MYNVNNSIQKFDIAFNKKIFKKYLNLVFSATDLFNTNNVNVVVAGQNLKTNFYKKEDSRAVRFRVSLLIYK
ncbi:outer membrane beta-barrel protein [Flavobacterium aquidurense]|uniref:outer membrane beta-barrel protein n=1 Tax=Flavobacterium TaxID=237 RepID=UPI003757DFC8